MITEINSAIYTSKLKVFAKLHKESEIWVEKWSVFWKSNEKKVLRYFLDTPILIYEISNIFTRWFKWLFGAWKINWPHKKLALVFTNNVTKFQEIPFQMIQLIKMLLDSLAGSHIVRCFVFCGVFYKKHSWNAKSVYPS